MLVIPVEKKLDKNALPHMLIGIVVLNVLIFIFYQAMDFGKIEDAVSQYVETGLAEKEWPL